MLPGIVTDTLLLAGVLFTASILLAAIYRR
jgi:hypothetical protein